MYLMIFDGDIIKVTKEVPKVWMDDIEFGTIDVIDITNPEKPLW